MNSLEILGKTGGTGWSQTGSVRPGPTATLGEITTEELSRRIEAVRRQVRPTIMVKEPIGCGDEDRQRVGKIVVEIRTVVRMGIGVADNGTALNNALAMVHMTHQFVVVSECVIRTAGMTA